jgi:hypothetical protein
MAPMMDGVIEQVLQSLTGLLCGKVVIAALVGLRQNETSPHAPKIDQIWPMIPSTLTIR